MDLPLAKPSPPELAAPAIWGRPQARTTRSGGAPASGGNPSALLTRLGFELAQVAASDAGGAGGLSDVAAVFFEHVRDVTLLEGVEHAAARHRQRHLAREHLGDHVVFRDRLGFVLFRFAERHVARDGVPEL